MAKNTGKPSQEIFEERIALLGKRAFLVRVTDMSAVRALNPKQKIKFPAQPADFLLTIDGQTEYAEVKSSQNATSFPFSQIEKEQWRCAKLQTAAGGRYNFYLHCLSTDTWYRVPAEYILLREKVQASVKWKDIEELKWNPNSLT